MILHLLTVFHQLSNDAYMEQDLEQEMDGRLLVKNTPNSTNRNRNIPPVGVNKMIDIDELPVNGRALPLSNR